MKNIMMSLYNDLLKFFFAIIIIPLMLMYCSNPVDNDKKGTYRANAGEDQVTYVGSYAIFNASKTKLPEGEEVEWVRWIQNPDNPELLPELGYSGLNETYFEGYYKEGTYKYILNIKCKSGNIYTDEMIVMVKPRQKSLIEDVSFEIAIRRGLKYKEGDLNASILQTIDSLIAYVPYKGKEIKNIKGIEYCTNVTYLILAFQNITDLRPLSNLTKLEYLDLNQNYTIEDLSPIYKLTNLKHLILFSNPIKDISGIGNLTNLVELDLNCTQVSNINPLSTLVNLEILDLSGSYWEEHINSLEPLRNLTKLKDLTIHGRGITDLTPLENLTELYFLGLDFNNITSLSPLSKMKKLIRLYIRENKIEDLTGLRDIRIRDYLALADNEIKDISELQYIPKIHIIELSGNEIEDIQPLVNNPKITGRDIYIFLERNPLSEKSINEYIPALRARGVNVVWQ